MDGPATEMMTYHFGTLQNVQTRYLSILTHKNDKFKVFHGECKAKQIAIK